MRACAKLAVRMQSAVFTAQVCVWTYRPYRISCTDVHIGIQTVIQTVVIYGTDVQTVSDSKGFEFIPPNCLRSLRLYSKSQRSVYRSVCQYSRLCNKCIRSVCLDARLCNQMRTVCMHYTHLGLALAQLNRFSLQSVNPATNLTSPLSEELCNPSP